MLQSFFLDTEDLSTVATNYADLLFVREWIAEGIAAEIMKGLAKFFKPE